MAKQKRQKEKCETSQGNLSAKSEGNGIFAIVSDISEKLKRVNALYTELTKCVCVLVAVLAFFGKNILRCELGIFIFAITVSILLKKHTGRGVIEVCLFGVILCLVLSCICMVVFGYVQIAIHPEGSADTLSDLIDGKASETAVLVDMEDVKPTESPVLTYAEKTFADKITSEVWAVCLETVDNVEIAGTEGEFQNLCEAVMRCMHGFDWDKSLEMVDKYPRKKLQENVDAIDEMEKQPADWSKYTGICALRKENYDLYPSMENTHQVGISALDCLYWMGKVNGKEGKQLKETIYNEENVLKYGNLAVEGIFGWWWMVDNRGDEQGAKEICFYFGQIFHHFGGCDEMTGDAMGINHLLLSAVFYFQAVKDDEGFYKNGLATHQQYMACEYLAIVFDKLDNKMRPADSFFLTQAEKYYRYSLYDVNMNSEEQDSVRSYLDIVEEKKETLGQEH